ncbi:hypothetical protein HNQ56_000425 [Anaerotaenia torta]|uniref:CPBP family glutamic-type intramembrane protease n=1 Tax=Anaerotaenia torta TaxID=433293 RepID=UPI003D23718C
MLHKSLKAIWIMFAIFIVLLCVNLVVKGVWGAAQRMWLVMDIWAMLLSAFLLLKHKLPSRKSMMVSALLGLLVLLSYIKTGGMSSVLAVAVTVLSSFAVFSTFESYGEKRLQIINKKEKLSIVTSLIWGLGAGVIWGTINYFLMISSNEPKFSIHIMNFLVALSPAILEEIAMRTLFFAFCLSLLRGSIENKRENFTCWFMMMVPHVLIHTPDTFINQGFVSGIISVVLYLVIFALPFAILQRKRDIASAMIAHGTVDAIRFCFFGLPDIFPI